MHPNNFIKKQKLNGVLIKVCILIPCLVLIRWIFNLEALESLLPYAKVMNPVTAVLFIFCVISFYCNEEKIPRNVRMAGKYISLFVVSVAIIRMIGFYSHLDIGIDQLLFTDRLHGNRMNLLTIINFVLVGLSLFTTNNKEKYVAIASRLLALSALIISLHVLLGHLYSSGTYNIYPVFAPMPVATSLTFLLFAVSILQSSYSRGFIGILTKKNHSGRIVRKLLPIGIGVPVLIELLINEGQHFQLYGEAFGTASGIILIIAVFTVLMLWLAASLSKVDEKRKEAELRLKSVSDELAANETKYRNLIENSVVVMYTTTLNGYLTFSNSKAYQLTGYTVEELSQMHFTQFIDADWLQEVKGKYKNQVKNNLKETVIEFCIRTKYGDLKWVEQSAVLVMENNLPVGFQCLVKDISERKEMEEVLGKYEVELVQSQKRLQSVLDNAASFIYIKDLEGKYLVVNDQFKKTFKVSGQVILGKTAFEFADPGMAKRFADADDEVLRTNKHVQIEEIIEMEDGKHHFLIIKFPLLDEQNNIYGSSGIGTDITERVRYEEQLIEAKKIAEEAKKMQEQFLANMSHEIRTPMNGIQGMTDLLLETRLNDEQQDFANTIKRSSDNLLVIINDILDFSKIQAGKLTIEKIDFKLGEVIENIQSVFKNRMQEKGLSFVFTIDENIPAVLIGDPYRLNQVLTNLVGNAIKFTPAGGITTNILLQQKNSGDIILDFIIADTGIGIEEGKINGIFESFTQASTETSRKYGGTGLGLAITRQLLEMQKGTIAAESKINVGTTFKFSLPYAYSEANSNLELLPVKDAKNHHLLLKGKKFLVAEDNEINQKVIRHVLQKAGGFVDIANNGLEAVSFLEKSKDYHLIIMDLQMPEMDGYAATKHIRNEMKLSIPIIAMTASAIKGEKAKCLEIGMDDYLSKPFDFNFLYKRITTLLSNTTPIKIPFMTNENVSNENLFNLSLLDEMEDDEYTTEIVTMFLESTPLELKNLSQACSAGDFEATYKIAHKLKSSTALLQANGLLKIITKLEELSKAGISDGLTVMGKQCFEEYKKIENPLKDCIKKSVSRLVGR
ncbi:MAG: PAS domain S-box protein [Ginsengibacter sp.]